MVGGDTRSMGKVVNSLVGESKISEDITELCVGSTMRNELESIHNILNKHFITNTYYLRSQINIHHTQGQMN